MKLFTENNSIPKNTQTKTFIQNIDFFDSYTIQLKKDEDIKELYMKAIDSPKWVRFLMKLRNKIVKLFGLKSVDERNDNYDFTIGKKIGIFTLYYMDENEIITGEKDSHLDFCVSFLKQNDTLCITTAVKYNNFLGKFYFFFVKPFHKVIVKNMMKKYI